MIRVLSSGVAIWDVLSSHPLKRITSENLIDRKLKTHMMNINETIIAIEKDIGVLDYEKPELHDGTINLPPKLLPRPQGVLARNKGPPPGEFYWCTFGCLNLGIDLSSYSKQDVFFQRGGESPGENFQRFVFVGKKTSWQLTKFECITRKVRKSNWNCWHIWISDAFMHFCGNWS